jgi:RHS repeat-associated protein
LILDKIEYDGAGRVQHWTTPDAKIDYDNFTLDGLPQSTAQTRYKNHSGLIGSQEVLDFFSQTHGYNGHGERTSYSVPGGTAGWSSGLTVHYDVMGNIDSMSTDGGFALTGDYRAAGRPNSRKITLPIAGGTSKTLERTYQYKQDTGQLLEMKAMVGNIPVAGLTVHYDGLLVDDAALIGVSGGVRHTRHSYDRRGRLGGSVVAAAPETQAPPPGAAASAPGSTAEALDPADFRTGQSRAPLLDPTVASLLQSRGIDTAVIDPPLQSATPAGGHKIATFTRGASTRTFDFALKSELVDDGLFHYHYDAKGRLDWAADKATATGVTIRRILYTYDANNRLVGRTAQAATVTSLTANYDTFAWSLETRQAILDADGIPAETTFVWDPISDRIIAVLRTGDSKIGSAPKDNVLKQIIHGDMGYDDPLEVTTLDAAALVAPGQPKPVTKLYPIYDEAAGGTLQVVVNRDGEVVARSVNNDPFGGAEFDLAGAAIDHVEIQTKKRADGALDSVTVTMRATEPLATASVASGARLGVVDANGALVRTSTVVPALASNDQFTVTWTLSAAEWTALSDPTAVNNRTPVALSIAATDTLHAALWRFDLPILPAPDWATTSQPVFSSSTLPVEVREPLATISSTIAALNPNESKTTTPYDVPNLGLIGTEGNAEIESLLAATFQAQPFAEPFTHKFYVRERWYDPMTGTWLTDDPLGYHDSANLYSFAGGDPVNRSDPDGTRIRIRGPQADKLAVLSDIKAIVASDNPEAAKHIDVVGDEVKIVGMTESDFVNRYGSFANLLGQMIQSSKLVVVGTAGRSHAGEKVVLNGEWGPQTVDLGDVTARFNGGVQGLLLKDPAMGIDRFKLGPNATKLLAGDIVVLYDRDSFPRDLFGVQQTKLTVLAHELFGHAFDDMIGFSSLIDFGVLDYPEEYRNISGVNAKKEAIGVWVENQYRKRANLPRRLWYKQRGDYKVPGPVFNSGGFVPSPFGPVKGIGAGQ